VVSNGATNRQSSSWSRRLSPKASASVAAFWSAGIVGFSSTSHRALDDPAVVFGDLRIEELPAQRFEAFVRAFLVRVRVQFDR
jgi:hypothetical protein